MVAASPALAAERRLPLGRLLFVMAGVYTIQSTLGAVMFQGVPAVLRGSGVALDLIGLVSLLMLPWTVKFLWAPVVERWRRPADGRRRSRPVIVAGQGGMALILVALAWRSPADTVLLIFAGLAVIALIASTVDIAADGYLIEQLQTEHRGWGNVAQVGGGYAGIMVGTGVFLVLFDHLGWRAAMLTMAVVAVALTLPSLATREPPGDPTDQARHRPSLRLALARPAMRWGLLAVVLCQLGLRLIQAMTGPFMIDSGVSPAELGLLTGTFGTALCLACVLLIGLPIWRWGARRILYGLLGAQGVIFALFWLAATVPPGELLLAGFFLAKAGIIAASFVALYTVAMDWTSPHQAGIDFTLLQCADALTAVVAGLAGGIVAQHLGYATCFGLATALALACLAILPLVFGRIERSRADV